MFDDAFDLLFTIFISFFLLFFLGGITIQLESNSHLTTNQFVERTQMSSTFVIRERASLYEGTDINTSILSNTLQNCQNLNF